MSRAAPRAPSRVRPSREDVLAARRARRKRVALYTASLVLATAAGIGVAIWETRAEPVPWFVPVLLVTPSVVAGLAAGRRMWPLYFFAALLAIIPMALFPALVTIVYTCVLVLGLGYGWHFAVCVATGRRFFAPPPREADAPRGVGGSSTGPGGVAWKRPSNVAGSAPTGRELRKRLF